MFRTLYLMKRRPGMDPEDFRIYYETRHRVLGEQQVRGLATFYARTYVRPLRESDPEPPYDVIMQLGFPNRAAFEQVTGRVANDPDLYQLFVEDELKLFDRAETLWFEAQPDSAAGFEELAFVNRRAGLGREEFRTRLRGEAAIWLEKLTDDSPEPRYDGILTFQGGAALGETAAQDIAPGSLTRFGAETCVSDLPR